MEKLRLSAILVVIAIASLSACSGGKPAAVNNANELFAQNKDEEAEKLLLKAAQDDYIDAQVRLAQYYEQSARSNPAEQEKYMADARLWYQRAIRNGSPEAEYHFGMLDCNEQINDPQSAESCQYWLESAARKGNTNAQVELANRYFSEREDPVALLNAQFWAEQAAPKSLAAADLLDKIQFAKIEDMNSVEWIVAQRPEKYTIQLNVFAELYDAIDYAFTWGLDGAAIYQDRMGNFGVVSGVFDSQAQADATINELPAQLGSVNTQSLSFERVLNFIPQENIQRAQQQNANIKSTNSKPVNVRQTPRQRPARAVQQKQISAGSTPANVAPAADTSQTVETQNNSKEATENAAQQRSTQTTLTEEPRQQVAQTDNASSSSVQQATIEEERNAYKQLLQLTQPKQWFTEQQKNGRYSIVLVRDVLPTQALRFIELTGVQGAYAYLKKDGLLFLLAGAFDTQEAAVAQINSLPKAFMQFDPKIVNMQQLP